MVYRCTEDFETYEGGYAVDVYEDTTWMRVADPIANGGYELVRLMGVDWQGPNGAMITVRWDRLDESFEALDSDEIWCPETVSEDA